MAEVIGALASGITLASLLKGCLDAIDLIQTAQDQELDLKKLVLRLNIEKCRLYTWGEAMGLTTASVIGPSRPLESCPAHVRDLARDTLEMIIQLFTDTKRLSDRYGCEAILPTTASGLLLTRNSGFGPIEKLAASFSHYRVNIKTPKKIKRLTLQTKWVIRDREKFISLVAEVKDFVDGLQNITKSLYPVAQQESRTRHGVQRISDVETLDLVTEVCKADHPAISDTASEKSEILSLTAVRIREIEQWTSELVTGLDPAIAEVESLTMTELKHRLLAYTHGYDPNNTTTGDLERHMLAIAKESERDSQTARVLTLVTLLFLPASFVSVSVPNKRR